MALDWKPGFGWKLHGDGKTPPPARSSGPTSGSTWGRTAGLGAQHVVAMFGATFVFPLVMGLDPNLAIMMSGVATILFLLITRNRVPSYLGTSASFVGAVSRSVRRRPAATSRSSPVRSWSSDWSSPLSGVAIRVLGIQIIHRIFPPVGHRRRGHADRIRPGLRRRRRLLAAGPVDRAAHDAAVFVMTVVLRGFWARIAILLGLVFGYVLSWLRQDRSATSRPSTPRTGEIDTTPRVSFDGVDDADWIGLPDLHRPDFRVLGDPARAARRHRPDRREHRPRQGRRRDDR